MINLIKHIIDSFKQSNKLYRIVTPSSANIDFKPAASHIDISYVEFCKLTNFVNKHKSKLPAEDFIISIESHAGSIGQTTIVKVRNWVDTLEIAEENITDYSNW